MDNSIDLKDVYRNGMMEFISGNYGASVTLFSEVLEANPDHTQALTSRGTAHLKMNAIDAAIADFDRVIEMDPQYARAFHLRGLTKEKKGDRQGASGDFETAIELAPEYGAAYFSRATLMTNMGQENEAAEDMAMVTHLTNRNIEFFANENNIWRSQHLRVETMLDVEVNR